MEVLPNISCCNPNWLRTTCFKRNTVIEVAASVIGQSATAYMGDPIITSATDLKRT